MQYTIEPFDPKADDVGEITELLHRAYAPLLAEGMNYTAATQSESVTKARFESASISWLAKRSGEIVGTISYYAQLRRPILPAWFARDDVGVFAQFSVDPQLQKRGIGRELLGTVERYAVQHGKRELACDTAENATQLRKYYARLGFREIALHRYTDANYDSVILTKSLNGEP
jgi:ribosomal protein S18 acetylase RimI-like enzyme